MLKQIELTPYEVASYWWVKKIKNKIKIIKSNINNNYSSKDEIDFYEIFKNYTEIEYRNIYLKLSKLIKDNVDNFVPNGMLDIFIYSQSTNLKKHNDLNNNLKTILNKEIKDIELNDIPTSILIDLNGCYEWTLTKGPKLLSRTYNETYILTGDNKKLDFYSKILNTLLLINKKELSYDSLIDFKLYYCTKYKENYSKEDLIEEIYSKFDDAINMAIEEEYITYDDTNKKFYINIDNLDMHKYKSNDNNIINNQENIIKLRKIIKKRN